MKILVCSDNHGDREVLKKILSNEVFDISVHLGDSQLSEKWISQNFTHYVGGNNDYGYSIYEKTFEFDKIKFSICHGHTIGLYLFTGEKPGWDFLSKTQGQVLLHGHTHIYKVSKLKDKFIICPGSTSYSRGKEGNGYVLITTKNHKVENIDFKNV